MIERKADPKVQPHNHFGRFVGTFAVGCATSVLAGSFALCAYIWSTEGHDGQSGNLLSLLFLLGATHMVALVLAVPTVFLFVGTMSLLGRFFLCTVKALVWSFVGAAFAGAAITLTYTSIAPGLDEAGTWIVMLAGALGGWVSFKAYTFRSPQIKSRNSSRTVR